MFEAIRRIRVFIYCVLLMIVVILYGCAFRVYWLGHEIVAYNFLFGQHNVEMVVVVSDPEPSVELKDAAIAEMDALKLYPVKDGLPQYVWVNNGDQVEAVYGIFNSLHEAGEWAEQHHFDFNAKAFSMRDIKPGTVGWFGRGNPTYLVDLPVVKRKDLPSLDVNVYTNRFDILPPFGSAGPPEATAREDQVYVTSKRAVYWRLCNE